MTQGPVCPTCGMYLRWFPELNQWGCDRCRTMVSATQARPPGAKKSRNALWIALGAIAVAGGGVAVAILAFNGKKSGAATAGSGGGTDRDTVVRDTFKALGAGDLEGLMANAGADIATQHGHCEDAKDREDEAKRNDKDVADMREELSRAATREKGATFAVKQIDETKVETLSKDKLAAHGCTFDTDITNHALKAKLEVSRDGTVSNVTATIDVLEVGSRYYVMKAPKLGGCSDAVARVALSMGRSIADPELAKHMQPAMIARCYKDGWPAKVTDCLKDKVLDDEYTECLRALDAKQLASLSAALATAVPGQGKASVALRGLVPAGAGSGSGTVAIADDSIPATPHDTKLPPNVTLGTPQQAPIGDFWIWPRSDGMYYVASPVVAATFPTKPTFTVAQSQFKTADNKPFDVYTIETENTNEQVKVMAIGRDARDVGGDPIEKGLAKLGTVTKAERTEGNRKVMRYTLVAGAETVYLDARKDMPRGLLINSLATKSTRKGGSNDFLASVEMRAAVDPIKDPSTLVGIRARKHGTKFVVHDKDDSFTVEVPWQPKVDRTVASNHVQVLATSNKGRDTVILTVAELASFDGLAQFGPTQFEDILKGLVKIMEQNGGHARRSTTTIAGLPAIKLEVSAGGVRTQNFTVWNRFQHRLYQLDCVLYNCEALAKSFHFADAEPIK